MTFADSSADCLAGLFPSTIFYLDILIWARPSMLLIPSCLENAFIGEDEMATILYYLVDLIPKLYGLNGIFLVERILLLRHINSLHFLELVAIKLEDLAIVFGFYDAIRELSMEQFGLLSKTQMSLLIHIVGVH